MSRFLEYTTNHPFLIAAAAILAVLAIVIEIRERAKGSSLIAPGDAVRLANGGALVLDVRDAGEYEAGHIIDSRNIPAREIAERAGETLKKFKEKPVIVICENGFASAGAVKALRTLGFSKVATLRGGLRTWRQENLPLVKGKKDGKQS
jgi:rhodanese-related sulfurtransferase